MSASMVTHSVSSTMSIRRNSLAGSWILFWALMKIWPSMPLSSAQLAKKGDVVAFKFCTPL